VSKRVAILEFQESHHECLYTLVRLFQDSGYEVHLFLNAKIKPRVRHLQSLRVPMHYMDLSTKLRRYVQVWLSLRYQFLQLGIDTVYLNTAERNTVLKFLALPFLRPTQVLGTLHNVQNLYRRQKRQLNINKRIDVCFVLSDYILDHAKIKVPEVHFESLYSIFYPDIQLKEKLHKPSEEKWIVVPGGIDFNKRDYNFLKKLVLPENYKIIFLGVPHHPDQHNLFVKFLTHFNTEQIVYFSDFIEKSIFMEYIKKADFILPLIHRNTGNFADFKTGKISGAFNLAFGYQKLLLMDKAFQDIEDFQDTSLFYDSEKVSSLTLLLTQDIQNTNFFRLEKWEYSHQLKAFNTILDKISINL